MVLAGMTASVLVACAPPVGTVAVDQVPVAPRVFDNSDPAVLVAGGATYLFGSSNNMHLPVRVVASFTGSLADSQAAWAQHPADAMPTRPPWIDPARWQIWAPTVFQTGNRFVALFAGHRGGASDLGNDQCIGRAVASSPAGPYAPAPAPIYCGLPAEPGSNWWGRGALDPEVFRSPDGGFHLVVALSRTRDNIGSVGLDVNGNVIGGPNAAPAILASQSLPWHGFLENPSMVYEPRTGTYLLFYSSGQWYTAGYETGIARCASPSGPCSLAPSPFLRSGNGRSGPGGLTVFKDPSGRLRAAYATWQAGFEGQSGPVGQYSRQTHWAYLSVSATNDPMHQAVSLQ